MENTPPIPSKISHETLSQETRQEIEDIANSQADVTPDGGRRSPTWTAHLVDQETFNEENPYRRK